MNRPQPSESTDQPARPASTEDQDQVRKKWHRELRHRETLIIVANTPLPPPAVGNSCILKGSIPEFLGVRDPDINAISFMMDGNPVIERRSGSSLIQRRLRPGSFGITPAGTDYEFRSTGSHTSLNIAITSGSLQRFAEQEMDRRSCDASLRECIEARTPHEIIGLFSSFAKLLSGPRQGSTLYAETLWTQIALQLLWHHSSIVEIGASDDTAILSRQRMEVVVDYLESNLGLDTSLAELAALVNLSPGHFLRAFKKATGCTPVRYRNKLRIARACHLLRHSSLGITQIAIDLGFASSSHFSTSFRHSRGVSPSTFRAESRTQ